MILDRFQDMRKFATVLQEELPALLSCGYGERLNGWVTESVQCRLKNPPLRAWFTAKMGEWLLGTLPSWKRIQWQSSGRQQLLNVQLPLIFETVIGIQYLHNQILDGKSGVRDRATISQNLLQANLLKEQLYRYIATNCPAWASASIEASVRQCFEQVDIGQQIELEWNTAEAFYDHTIIEDAKVPEKIRQYIDFQGASEFIEKIKLDLPEVYHAFTDLYFTKVYLTCASLFIEVTRLLSKLLGLSNQQTQGALQFSVCYGLMRQLINDNADWLPSEINPESKAKTNEDVFCDLRKGIVTLPLIFFLSENTSGLIPHLANKNMAWSAAFEHPIYEEMLYSQALYKSIQNVRILAELAIAYLPQDCPSAIYLSESCEIAHWNKYLKPCLKHSAYQVYRKTGYHNRTKKLITTLRHQRNAAPLAIKSWQFRLRSWFGHVPLPAAVLQNQITIRQELTTHRSVVSSQ